MPLQTQPPPSPVNTKLRLVSECQRSYCNEARLWGRGQAAAPGTDTASLSAPSPPTADGSSGSAGRYARLPGDGFEGRGVSVPGGTPASCL
ncbi:hypothetical protein MATL_G00000250 [Megalops atlanticus]|uniref:Uncharacterized protein n=1 Tax=Megalops atlanticus TaxID=7932 RepID=A0A9D3TCX0_MEGAT|nr:hypothetical protein MATL_G00000250 [Megalops atlanticus]